MKYMLMMFGDGATMMHVRSADWVTDMIGFMHTFNAETAAAGELVEARGLADPGKARTVSVVDGRVVVTDGPYAPAQDSLAGFWILQVDGEHRAIELASRVAVWAGRVEVREVPDAPAGR